MAKSSTSFKKGQSGNPKGAPLKDNCLTNLLKKNLDKQKFIKSVCENAYNGDVTAQKYIFDRLDGKVPDTIKHEIEKVIFELQVPDDLKDE
jgi:hypothetical protein